MSAAQYADPYQLADPRGYAEMQTDLSNSEMFRKKADEWDEAHGLKYHLVTVGLILTTGLFGILLALGRTNPHRSLVTGLYARYEMKHDEIAKAHGLPTINEIWRNAWREQRTEASARPAPTRPTQARRPAPPRATLAA